MSEAEVAEMLKLPVEERLCLIELPWESLCASPSAVSLSEAHRAAIDGELAEHRSHPDEVLTLEQVLRQPLSHPHPESLEMAEVGFATWAEGLPDDASDLIAPGVGEGVRWTAGRGWVDTDE